MSIWRYRLTTPTASSSAEVTKANDRPLGPLTRFTMVPHVFGQDEDGDFIEVWHVSADIPARTGILHRRQEAEAIGKANPGAAGIDRRSGDHGRNYPGSGACRGC